MPIAIRKLMGPSHHGKAYDNRGIVLTAHLPDKPEFICGDKIASDFWDEVGPELEKMSIISEIDQTMFAALCSCYSLYRKSEQALKKGLTYKARTKRGIVEKARPEVGISAAAEKQFISLCSCFGIGPKSRQQLLGKTNAI